MSITASQVNELREKTGVGLMDCKKVLVETEGDIEQAIKKLREKGLAKAAKKSDRSTTEGRVFIAVSSDNTNAVILELNCETDFVGSNDEFSKLGTILCDSILSQSISSVDDLTASQINNTPYQDFLSEYILKLGENISVKQFKTITNTAYVSSYTHMNGKIGVLVAFNAGLDDETAKSIAMQVAATAPSCVRPEEVNENDLNAEKEIIKNQALSEGKPENIVDKIVDGRINKYYKEVCLLEQPFIKDDKQAVKQTLPKDTTVVEFIRFALS